MCFGGGGVIAANVQEDSGGTAGTSARGPSGQGEAVAIEMGQPRAEGLRSESSVLFAQVGSGHGLQEEVEVVCLGFWGYGWGGV